MRPVHLTDLDAVVRSVLHLANEKRVEKITETINAAQLADRYRKRIGSNHPKFGNGSLTSAASRPVGESFHCNSHYRACLRDLLCALEAKTAHQSA